MPPACDVSRSGSFLPAKTFPQFADVGEMVATVAALPGAHGIALVLNERGANDALASGVAEIASVVSATEEHSQANASRSRDAAIANDQAPMRVARCQRAQPIVHAAISMALGCSIAGAVDPNEVLRLVDRCFEAGADAVGIADTVGFAGPKQVGELTAEPPSGSRDRSRSAFISTIPAAWALPMRPPRSMPARAFSMARSAGSAAARSRRARPAMSCSRIWYSCARARALPTGIDIEKLVAVRAILREQMPDEPLYGGLARAGLPSRSGPGQRKLRYSFVPRSRSALPTTLTDDSAIAAAAMIGDSRMPNAG